MMPRTFGRDGQAVHLPGQTDGEVANVDHLLYFAQAFLSDFARFPRHQFTQVGLVRAQRFAK